MMPRDLQRDAQAQEKTRYVDVHAYVIRQISARREEERRQARSGRRDRGASGGDAATDPRGKGGLLGHGSGDQPLGLDPHRGVGLDGRERPTLAHNMP